MKERALKVLMMGGERSGKTSVLAGVFDAFINGSLSTFLSITDITQYETREGKKVDSLVEKTYELVNLISSSFNKTILIDEHRTSSFVDYEVLIGNKRSKNNLSILFTDANGEFYQTGKIHAEEIKNKVASYDVFIIAIDTPSLMASREMNQSLCTESTAIAINRIEDIHNFLAAIDDASGNNAKLVLFTPIKCEYWARRSQLDAVCARVQEVYETSICALSSHIGVEIDIVPVQTAGAIEFAYHSKPQLLIFDDEVYPCHLLDNQLVHLSNGDEIALSNNDKIVPNPESVLFGNIIKPYTWYTVIDNNYAPHNCEQLAFFILEFLYKKIIVLKKQTRAKQHNVKKNLIRTTLSWVVAGIPGLSIYLLYKIVQSYMGKMSLNEIQGILDKLNSDGYIRKGHDGIMQLKTSNLDN